MSSVCHMCWACLGVSLAILVFIRLSWVCLGCRGVLVLHWSRLSFALACIYLKPVNNYPAVLAFVKCTLGFGFVCVGSLLGLSQAFLDLGTILGSSVALWGHIVGLSQGSLGDLGTTWDNLGLIFRSSWVHRSEFLAILKTSWTILGHPEAILGTLEPSWDQLGSMLLSLQK